MKKILAKLSENSQSLKSSTVLNYINQNYYNFQSGIPTTSDLNSSISIDSFNEFLTLRGIIKEKKENKDAAGFINNKVCQPNLQFDLIRIPNIRSNVIDHKFNEFQYKQILLNDCLDSFATKCDANNFPHPFVIYNGFAFIEGFSFQSYNENNDDKKIFMNYLLQWIMKFILYGSFNEKKIGDKEPNYLNILVNFIDLCMENEDNQGTLGIQLQKFPEM